MTDQHSHINRLIEDYHSGRLTDREMHNIERQALENPLLADALEGYEGRDFGSVQTRLRMRFRHQGRGRGWMWVSVGLVLIGGLVWWMWPSDEFVPEMLALEANTEFSENEIISGNSGLISDLPETRDTDSSVQVMFRAPAQIVDEKFAASLPEANFGLLPPPTTPKSLPMSDKDKQPKRAHAGGDRIQHIHDYKVVDYSGRPAPDNRSAFLTGITAAHESDPELIQPLQSPYIQVLREAIAAFASRDYAHCLKLFNAVLATYPDDLNALFYSGMSRFERGEFELAIPILKAAEEHPGVVFREEARFYRALALLSLPDRREEGRLLMHEVRMEGGFYSKRAEGYD